MIQSLESWPGITALIVGNWNDARRTNALIEVFAAPKVCETLGLPSLAYDLGHLGFSELGQGCNGLVGLGITGCGLIGL